MFGQSTLVRHGTRAVLEKGFGVDEDTARAVGTGLAIVVAAATLDLASLPDLIAGAAEHTGTTVDATVSVKTHL